MAPQRRNAVIGATLHPVLEYREMSMERHLTLALNKVWVSHRKTFTIIGKRVRLAVFDVVLLSSFPIITRKVGLHEENSSIKV